MVKCPNCGAPEGIRCTVQAARPTVGPRKRRVPCLARVKAAAVAP
ncbi:hypothetical protein ACXPWS_13535 [Mycobacterium sp. BMJ-28]